MLTCCVLVPQQPPGAVESLAYYIVLADQMAQVHRQTHGAARKKRIRSGLLIMLQYKVVAWHAVAVRKNQVVAAGLIDSLVENRALAKAVFFVPHVPNRHARSLPYRFDLLGRVVVRSVVGDQDLKLAKALRRLTPEHFFEPFG